MTEAAVPSSLGVTVTGVDYDDGKVFVRDFTGREMEINGHIRPKGMGMPYPGERWVIVKDGGIWRMAFQVGAEPITTITGSRSGMSAVEQQILDVLVKNGLAIDGTGGPEEQEIDDPAPEWEPDEDMPEPPPEEPIEVPDPFEPPKDDGPGDYDEEEAQGTKPPKNNQGGTQMLHADLDLMRHFIYLGTINVPFHMGNQRATRDVMRFARTKVQVFGTQEFWPDARMSIVNALDDKGWGHYRPSSPPHAEAVTIFWRRSDFELLDKDAFLLTPAINSGDAHGPPRSLAWVKLKHRATGRRFYFASTHYDALVNIGHNPSRIYSQVAQTANFMRNRGKDLPVFTVMDSNRNWREDSKVRNPRYPYAAFRRANTVANWDVIGAPRNIGTHGHSLIDTVWGTRMRDHNVRMVSQNIITGQRSDHRPVVVKVELLRKKGRGRGR